MSSSQSSIDQNRLWTPPDPAVVAVVAADLDLM